MHYRFEWDNAKARANVAKHGVTFDEARTVFTDRWAIETYDREHSIDEDRLMINGMSDHNRLLVVAFTLRDHETIRIISTRRAKRDEEQAYEENLRNP
ncbi:MAG: BrnT family toxin [Acidobacteriota bacterium]|nr:BrnT family toxin [Acidobacteriota bacterium]